MDIFFIITILISLSALFGYINTRFLRLPQTIGLMIIAILFSLLMLAMNAIAPSIFHYAEEVVNSIDFSKILLNIMLCFLLFAGALHTDSSMLKKEKRSIVVLSLVSVVLSTFFIAGLIYLVSAMLHHPIGFIYCLLFGALISPTDPIAVLGILTRSSVPEKVRINIVGESLFNDGVGVVLFATILEIIHAGTGGINFGNIALLFIREAGGGILFGLLLGYLIFFLLKSIDNYQTEVMITLAVVMGGYLIASELHISGPLAMVVAGLFTGSSLGKAAMSQVTSLYVDKFWELVDMLMNAILFVLIGLKLMLLQFTIGYLFLALLAIPIVLIARWISIRIPLLFAGKRIGLDEKAQLLMTWGGLRGGLSIAMALSLSGNEFKDLFVFITYTVVLFSIIVQGLTVERVAKKLYRYMENGAG